ncbi:MAG: MaoC family dehydratase N-terminal domain-containing protein [Myxococcaceae bacterium]|nr:MaoC family dehydratase N-terminal domain-containing protein [Myxococcaceae bacterium]
MLDRHAVGRSTPPTLNEVEKGAIRRFAESVGDFNPVHYDEEYAKASGFPSVLAPATFPASFHTGVDLRELLGVPVRSLLSAEMSIEYERPICAGDRILVSARVAEVQERVGPAGKMEVATLEEEGRDEKGVLIYRARKSYLVRPKEGA